MSKFLMIDVLQEPFPIGKDGSQRIRYGFNILVTKTQSDTFDDEIAAILVGAGVTTLDNIFIGPDADIPTGNGPYLSVNETGGIAGLRIHDQLKPAYPRPGAQIVCRATSAPAARTMARAAYNALAGVSNSIVTP